MLAGCRLAWAERRNRLIAGTAVRRLARWFPWPARRYALRLFDLSAGFVYSQVVLGLVESGLLDRLSVSHATTAQAAAAAGLPEAGAETLLKAGAALDLVDNIAGRWCLRRLGAALVASPGLAEMIAHHRLLYSDLADPLAMLRGETETHLARLWRYGDDGTAQDSATYSALMAATQPMVAEQAIAAYSFRRHRNLLDVGGGSGAFLSLVARAAPHLNLGLFDRPSVQWIEHECAIKRHAGDFLTDPLPHGYDLISLVRVLHDHDDLPATRLLRAVHEALPRGGRVLIVEPLADTRGARAMGHAYFGFYLAAMRSGRPRSHREYKAMLHTVGFTRIARHPTPLPLIASVISAERERPDNLT